MEKRKLKLAATFFIFKCVAADFSLRIPQVIIQIWYNTFVVFKYISTYNGIIDRACMGGHFHLKSKPPCRSEDRAGVRGGPDLSGEGTRKSSSTRGGFARAFFCGRLFTYSLNGSGSHDQR